VPSLVRTSWIVVYRQRGLILPVKEGGKRSGRKQGNEKNPSRRLGRAAGGVGGGLHMLRGGGLTYSSGS